MSESNDDDLRGLVGLQNLGNTCYINSALQALSNCQQLTRFVLDCPQFLKDKGIFRSYSELIEEIWSSKSLPYAIPSTFIRNIRCIYPAFRGCTQQDTQEFLRCFLEQLHDELKQLDCREQNSNDGGSNIVESTGGNTSGDINDISNNCNNIKNNNNNNNTNQNKPSRSIISDTFEFKISSSVVCSSCNNISTRKETFKDLSIPIPSRDHPYYLESENQDLKSNTSLISWLYNYLTKWIWGPQVTLQDCLSIFFGTDPLEGDNEYSCEVCTKKNRGVKYLKILELPEVLCIHFKRYETIGSTKITTHVSFPLTGLDLAPFMSENSKAQCTTYNLIACICHHGTALLTGHYTTYALNCFDDQWYEFDDQYVTNVEDYQVKNSEAYILFYQKSSLDDRTDRERVKASNLFKTSLTDVKKFYISKQWVNKFNTFVEPGPITNFDFLCEHEKVPKARQNIVSDLVHQVSETVWVYLHKLHGGGPECQELIGCDLCE